MSWGHRGVGSGQERLFIPIAVIAQFDEVVPVFRWGRPA
jgi:hypothetical protein